MNKLKFLKEGNRFYHFIYTEDKKYMIEREEFEGPYKTWWHVFKREADGLYYTIMSPYFKLRADAMAWVCEHYYPGWKLQKKLTKFK